jgi:FkbH-like protein
LRFTEALEIVRNRPDAPRFSVTLACGFTPLHLQTFLAAHLQSSLPDRAVEVAAGLYGDLAGTVERLSNATPHAAAVAIEWPDLDPRLGYRHTGGWGPSDLADIVQNSQRTLARLEQAIRRAAVSIRVVVALPTLALPPVFHAPSWQSSESELRLAQAVMELGAAIARLPNAAVVSAQHLGRNSGGASRFDFKAELLTGLPYTLAHADALGSALASLILPRAPLKGLITDLDDTLWNGIAGDAGVEGVTWDLASHSQIHGLYQQLLRALSEQGVLIAVASKNDPGLVKQVFERPGMLLPAEKVFPMEAHWRAKSGSVGRILKTWNIGADSVVFVDDSPMELAEVELAHPGIHCMRFPKNDYAGAVAFLRNLRDLFGKSQVTAEDALRLNSIRRGAEFQQMTEDASATPEAFMAEMKARLTVDFESTAAEPRVLELVNKTNQFNLNGRRYADADWRKELERPGAFLVSVAYEDRFGPLGKIAVIRGFAAGDSLDIETWVMSCRAFARRIEYQCLRLLLETFGADSIRFDFKATAKNGPIQDFLETLLGRKPGAPFELQREELNGRFPVLYHTVEYAGKTGALQGL